MTNKTVNQAVILAGGLGTRLGDLTQETPKPLLTVGHGAFMDVLINELARHGIGDVLISAGYLGGQFSDHYRDWRAHAGMSCSVRVFIEPEPLGTAGALRYLEPELEEEFLLLNGDSWFDLDWLDFLNRPLRPHYLAKLALRQIGDVARYGSVDLNGDRIAAFREKGKAGPGLISGGVYHLSRHVLDGVEPGFCSLEHSVLPPLVSRGAVGGWAYDGYFIDIGTPESYGQARHEVPEQLSRWAVVFRMQDIAPANSEDFDQVEVSDDAVEAFRIVRAAGGYVFVLTASSGPHAGSRRGLNAVLRPRGVQIDCLVSPDPETGAGGVIASVLSDWGVQQARALLVGQEGPVQALARQLAIGFVNVMPGQISKVLGTRLVPA